MNVPKVKSNLIDDMVGYFNPRAKMQRMRSKMALAYMEDSGYITPRSSRKSMRGSNAVDYSADRDTAPKVRGSRALSRDMYMNTPLMVSILDRFKVNVVGAGLVPQPSPDTQFLGLDPVTAATWVRNVQREFNLWASSPFSSWSNNQTFWDLQGLALLSVLMNGDAFFALPWKQAPDSRHPYELKIKLIEADLVRNPLTSGWDAGVPLPGSPDIVGGIEYADGQLVAYHVADKYFLDPYSGSVNFQRIPAWDASGRRQMSQIFDPARIGQRRGMPLLASTLEMMKQLSRLTESQLMGALVRSLFTVFVKDMSGLGGAIQEGFIPADTVGGGGGAGPDAEQQQKDPVAAWELEMAHGNVVFLDDDKEIQLADPKGTDVGFEPFFDALVTQIAASVGQSKSQALIKFDASYSAARGEILEVWKTYRTRRAWFSRSFLQPVYEAFLEEAIIKGRIDAPGFLTDSGKRHAWSACAWVGPGMGQLDPLKEANAAVTKIKNGLATCEEEYTADRGGSWPAMMERRSREKTLFGELGLPDPTDAPAVMQPAAPTPEVPPADGEK